MLTGLPPKFHGTRDILYGGAARPIRDTPLDAFFAATGATLREFINLGLLLFPRRNFETLLPRKICHPICRADPSHLWYFETRWACLPTDRRHGIASAQAICPSKPSVLALSR